jgi:hypothetical protein
MVLDAEKIGFRFRVSGFGFQVYGICCGFEMLFQIIKRCRKPETRNQKPH